MPWTRRRQRLLNISKAHGQQAGYLIAQLKGFRERNRSEPRAMAYMWGMAPQLNDNTIADISHFLAGRKPTEPQKGGALSAEGQKMYADGVEAHNIPPYATCHGDHGKGNGEIPRLAGQHPNYLKMQLGDFRSLVRNNDVMHANTKDMTNRKLKRSFRILQMTNAS